MWCTIFRPVILVVLGWLTVLGSNVQAQSIEYLPGIRWPEPPVVTPGAENSAPPSDAVVLFDEIEKAHPDVFNILLQILEDGRLTDSQGRTVDFRHAIVIMTSNIGAQEIARNTPLGFAVSEDETGITYEDMKSRIMGELKKVFRPEFLNRIDDVIVFHKLQKEEITTIVELLLRRIRGEDRLLFALPGYAAAMGHKGALVPRLARR